MSSDPKLSFLVPMYSQDVSLAPSNSSRKTTPIDGLKIFLGVFQPKIKFFGPNVYTPKPGSDGSDGSSGSGSNGSVGATGSDGFGSNPSG